MVSPTTKITGSRLLVKALKEEKIQVLFGYPGGVVIPIFDALFDTPEIRVVLTRHEQGAVHAADGYARSTGRVGVCLVTSGPGATNTVTGLATANFDSVPLVCLTGQVARHMIGNDAFQEADTMGITRPVTKHNFIVLDRRELGRVIREAFLIASTGRPGPVVVDLPVDVMREEGDPEYPRTVQIRGYKPIRNGHIGQIRKAAEELNRAERPLFYVGGGVHIAGASELIRKMVDRSGAPLVSSLMGIGVLPGDHPANLGMLGMHGTSTANRAVTHCDLLFAVGTRFDDRATGNLSRFAPEARIIHIDIDPTAIARNVPVHIPIVGDARCILEEILPLLKKLNLGEWMSRIESWQGEDPVFQGRKSGRAMLPEAAPALKAGRVTPEAVVRAISDLFPDAIITTEVGQNQMWAAQYYNFRRTRSLLTSGGLGTMGYGFPAAIGAQLGNPDRKVIDIAGDGSIQMNIQELATAVHEGLPVIVAILNNGYLGMVRQWQELFFRRRYYATCLQQRRECPAHCTDCDGECPAYVPDFVKLAEAYGAIGMRVNRPEEVGPVLMEAGRSRQRPVILDFLIDREADVFPMVPAGASLNEMILRKGENP